MPLRSVPRIHHLMQSAHHLLGQTTGGKTKHPILPPLFREDIEASEELRPPETPTAVLDTVKGMGNACRTCQELPGLPFFFRVSIPADDPWFNADVAIDLVWVGRNPCFHVSDTHTSYQNVTFICDK